MLRTSFVCQFFNTGQSPGSKHSKESDFDLALCAKYDHASPENIVEEWEITCIFSPTADFPSYDKCNYLSKCYTQYTAFKMMCTNSFNQLKEHHAKHSLKLLRKPTDKKNHIECVFYLWLFLSMNTQWALALQVKCSMSLWMRPMIHCQ